MIVWTRGDLLQDDAEALVNAVNCVGVMGRGIALQFKKTWPANFRAYAAACHHGKVRPGQMFVVDLQPPGPPRCIINFPTKRHWRDASQMADIEAGLSALCRVLAELCIRSVAIPPLGCGLGGLAWRNVRPRIEAALSALDDVCVRVYEPDDWTASAHAGAPFAQGPK